MKDDNLGLGAQRGKAEGQNFGLLGFNDLLGRLNGKDEKVIEEQQRKRVEIGQMLYAQQKWGGTRFVSGGFLVGDRIEEKKPGENGVVEVNLGHTENGTNVKQTEEKNVEVVQELVEEAKKESKKRKSAEEKAQRRLDKAARKEKEEKKAKASKSSSSSSTDAEDDAAATTSANEKEARKETKEERRQRRAERRARKEEKRKKRAAKSGAEAGSEAAPLAASTVQSGASTPALPSDTSGRSTPVLGAGLSVRQRYIKQKRMASMDPQALREVSRAMDC